MLSRQIQSEAESNWESVKIVDAHTEKERQAIYRFRYQVQVGEMNRNIPGIDYRHEYITDELDSWSYLVYAILDGRIIGTVRATVGNVSDFPDELIQVLQLERFRQFDPASKNICLGTKLMVDPQFRKTPVFFQLMVRGYEILREHNVQFNFGGCNPYLIPMYEKLGYRRFTAGFQDPGYGFIVPILLLPEDSEHLKAVRSPYLRIARKFANSPAAREWYLTHFPEAAKYPVGPLTSEQERWDYIIQRIGHPLDVLPVLRDLDEAGARKLLHIATTIECTQGHEYIRQGDVCNELNILIAGEMVISDKAGRTFRAGTGDIIGSVGLLKQCYHAVDAVAATDCEILTVSRFSFEKLQRALPEMADKLQFNNQVRERE
ncbi:hypothetical protein SCACP_34320 [Sporomusa carbonis]|uniref:N-acyl amino acid synthase FeeM domain-containing protein n=1 Tax=Sporomusa carbonis TaxID=3076075 RepID=UPI003A611879